MQRNLSAKLTVTSIAYKEIALFFASPIAYIFLLSFAAISLFIFFWGESFYSRNIADVRPLFEWMPVLLIFLCSTLTMKLWSEERRSGTLEFILTQAVPIWHFVVGKFLACFLLLFIALIITLPLPITVSYMGDLDWGPVWAGYLATLLLGSAYLSIGLFLSSRNDNQIVSLISACFVSGLFFLVGSPLITDFFSHNIADTLRLVGTGSRFESITRGVIDIRDFYFYISLIIIFLALNNLTLEKERWVRGERRTQHRQWYFLSLFVIANAIAGNWLLGLFNSMRVDVTHGNQYSISNGTQDYLNQLQEPLLIRGYFSAKTHPLLAPLVPQMRDLLKEYQVAGGNKVRVEFIDPQKSPEQEQEANQKFGIQAVPFQVSDRYQSAIVSSYFNVLVKYGDEHQVLGFKELIEVKSQGPTDIEVQLRNPEYDITKAIKRTLRAYQSEGNLFDNIKGDLNLVVYASNNNKLPPQLAEFNNTLKQVISDFQQLSANRLSVSFVDPDANNGAVAKQIADNYGFKPMTSNLFSQQQFFFYVTLQNNKQIVQVSLGDLSQDNFKQNLESGIKRFGSGFMKTIALVSPKTGDASAYAQGTTGFNHLTNFLGSELNVINDDLSTGVVPDAADILFLLAPENLNSKQLFAIDQFLMKGGTVIAATSPYAADFASREVAVKKYQSGLQAWLNHHGLIIQDSLVLDPQSSPFPVPVTRNIGGLSFQEYRMLDYPYFPDIRKQGFAQNMIVSTLPQITMAWSSPITIRENNDDQKTYTPLLSSSNGSWSSASMDVMPRMAANNSSSFTPEGKQQNHSLAVIAKGRFDSFFAGKPSPLIENESMAEANASETDNTTKSDTKNDLQLSSVIEHSSPTAKIILFASNEFLRDQILQTLSNVQQAQYVNSLQMIANTIDWSLEEQGLLSIRARSHFNRTLIPLEQSKRVYWEYINYGLALFLIAFVAITARFIRSQKKKKYQALLAV